MTLNSNHLKYIFFWGVFSVFIFSAWTLLFLTLLLQS